MKLLLDECLPWELRELLCGHDVSTVEDAGLKGLENGKLLIVAGQMFDVLITIDKGIEYQQNLTKLPVAIILLCAQSNRFEHLRDFGPDLLVALHTISRGEFVKIYS